MVQVQSLVTTGRFEYQLSIMSTKVKFTIKIFTIWHQTLMVENFVDCCQWRKHTGRLQLYTEDQLGLKFYWWTGFVLYGIGGNIHSSMDKIWRVNVSLLYTLLKYLYTVHA